MSRLFSFSSFHNFCFALYFSASSKGKNSIYRVLRQIASERGGDSGARALECFDLLLIIEGVEGVSRPTRKVVAILSPSFLGNRHLNTCSSEPPTSRGRAQRARFKRARERTRAQREGESEPKRRFELVEDHGVIHCFGWLRLSSNEKGKKKTHLHPTSTASSKSSSARRETNALLLSSLLHLISLQRNHGTLFFLVSACARPRRRRRRSSFPAVVLLRAGAPGGGGHGARRGRNRGGAHGGVRRRDAEEHVLPRAPGP